MAQTVEPNAHVTLAYVLRSPDGEILDASSVDGGGPLTYVHGYGMIVPGLEVALLGMKVGERKIVVVPAVEGYGEHDPELMLEIERAEFPNPDAVAVGDEFVAESPDGDEVSMRVVEVKAESVMVDANHPLAGMTLHYEVEVQALRDATKEEIEQAAAELEAAAEHEHGPDCDHDHDKDVVPLGRKPAGMVH